MTKLETQIKKQPYNVAEFSNFSIKCPTPFYEDKSNYENLDYLMQNFDNLACGEGYNMGILACNEFKFVLIEERKNYYKQGYVIKMMQEGHYATVSTAWRRGTAKQTGIDYLYGLSQKAIYTRIDYYDYIDKIQKQGRGIEDIFEIEPNQISEINNVADENRLVEVEQFVIEKKIKVTVLKRLIEIINADELISLEKALEQAESYAEEKKKEREDKKLNRIKCSEPYIELKNEINEIKQALDCIITKNTELEEHNKTLQAENAEILAQNQELEKELNALKSNRGEPNDMPNNVKVPNLSRFMHADAALTEKDQSSSSVVEETAIQSISKECELQT